METETLAAGAELERTEGVMALPDYYWDMYVSDEPEDEDYLECSLCTHAMNDECGIGEYDYLGPGQHICSCCSQDEPDSNEEQPVTVASSAARAGDGGASGDRGEG